MKLLLCHNYYQQRGGEDESFDDEADLLRNAGHDVVLHTRHSDEIQQISRLSVAAKSVFNRSTGAAIRRLIRAERPDVVHCTNTFPLISPAVFKVARAEGVPVVLALRNYRWLCPAAVFTRNGKVCEDCLNRQVAWPGVLHGCYRGSRVASAVAAASQSIDRWRGWRDSAVKVYYTPSAFARHKYIEGGFPADKVVVKPNFIRNDPGLGNGSGKYFVFVGRLAPEKGLDTLLDAWSKLKADIGLKIVGDGPLSDYVSQAAQHDSRIEALGRRSNNEVLSILGSAACLVMPSTWYETFGRTIAEAYSKGTPVLVSRLGAMAELVEEGITGHTFAAGDANELAEAASRLWDRLSNDDAMRVAARDKYEREFTAERNYGCLMAIYNRALGRTTESMQRPTPHFAKVRATHGSVERSHV